MSNTTPFSVIAFCVFTAVWGGQVALADTASPALTAPMPLATGIDALPRLAPSSPAHILVNTELDKNDVAASEFIVCSQQKDGAFSRQTAVTYAGPDFLSLSDKSGGYCEGYAHPWTDERYLSFDLATGAVLDFARFMPKAMGTPSAPSDAFLDQYIAGLNLGADDECRAVLLDYHHAHDLTFDLWLDGAAHSLGVIPNGLAHAVSACAAALEIPVDTLRTLGFDAVLLDALAL